MDKNFSVHNIWLPVGSLGEMEWDHRQTFSVQVSIIRLVSFLNITIHITLQSDTFAEGERPESPQIVGEKLSREGSPTQEEEHQPDTAALEPGTPERSRPGVYHH